MEEQLRPLAHQGGHCTPRALMMGLKIIDHQAFAELEVRLMACDDGLGKVFRACNRSRVVLQRHERVSTEDLRCLSSALVEDGQHCLFKYGALVFDPDDGSTGSFEDFAKDRDAREKLVAASVRVFRTEAEATAYKQQEKKKRKQRAQQEEQQRKRKKAASGAP